MNTGKPTFPSRPPRNVKRGLASVVIPSYNKAPYIRKTLDSLSAQTYPDIEVIIVDDASSDTSLDIIRDWMATAEIPSTLLVHRENQGVCKTVNAGLALASGEFLAGLAADDRYLPHKISRHIELMEANPDAVFAYGDARIEGPDGETLHDSFAEAYLNSRFPSGHVFHDLLRGNFIPAPAVTIRASALDLVGPYDEDLPYEDYDMWLRLSTVGELICSHTVDVVYLDTPDSLSKRLGSDLDVGHLKVMTKHKGAPGVNRRALNSQAVVCARRAARNYRATPSLNQRLGDVARMASLYGGPGFVAQTLAVELWELRFAAKNRARSATEKFSRISRST